MGEMKRPASDKNISPEEAKRALFALYVRTENNRGFNQAFEMDAITEADKIAGLACIHIQQGEADKAGKKLRDLINADETAINNPFVFKAFTQYYIETRDRIKLGEHLSDARAARIKSEARIDFLEENYSAAASKLSKFVNSKGPLAPSKEDLALYIICADTHSLGANPRETLRSLCQQPKEKLEMEAKQLYTNFHNGRRSQAGITGAYDPFGKNSALRMALG